MSAKSELARTMLAARDADLAASGIDKPSVLKRLRIGAPLPPEQTRDLTGLEDVFSYALPYFELSGKQNGFARYKLIALRGEAPFRYWQPEQTLPHFYTPPLVDWKKVAADSKQRIVFTEGEKKAAAACLHRIPCVGLGGVWGFKSKRWSMTELPEFESIVWEGRTVEVCYDSDLYQKENVAHALNSLADLLVTKGARVFVRYLPKTREKIDLDTFLVAHGAEAYEDLDVREYQTSLELAQLNDDLVYVKEIQSYYSTNERRTYGDLVRLRRRYGSVKIKNPQTGKLVPAVKLWVEWPHMRMAERLTYEPGRELFVDGDLNTWRSWGAAAKRGDVHPFQRIVAGFGDAEFQRWFWQWLAFPIQNPGAKINQAVVLWSPEHGTGKSLTGDVLRDIYGANAAVIRSHDLSDARYSWIQERQFIVAEEVTRPGDRAASDLLKDLITGETIRVNEKYVPAFSIPNKANFLFLSNNPDPVHVDPADRRFAVARSHNDPHDAKFWSEVGRWREAGGAAHLRHHLEHEIDCAGFNPKAHAPMTKDKQQMIRDSMSSLEQWCADLLLEPDTAFGDIAKAVRGRDVFTAAELRQFLPQDLERSSSRALTNALVRAGAVRAIGGGVVTTEKGSRRLIAIRNCDYWRKQDAHGTWRANYDGKMTVAAAKGKKS